LASHHALSRNEVPMPRSWPGRAVTDEERDLISKIRLLSSRSRGELAEVLDAMLDRDDTRRLVEEAFEISSDSFARYWGPRSDAIPKKSL
jgi:hypothetical protein